MNPEIDKAAAFDRKWSKMLDKLDADEREMIETVVAGAQVNYTALYMLIAAVFGVAIGVAAMGLWG
jgi:hypothetical protein